MLKILIALNPEKFEVNTIDFACYVARLTHSGVTGIFLENKIEKELSAVHYQHGNIENETIDAPDIRQAEERKISCEKNIRFFRQACINRSVNYHIHRDCNLPFKEMILESRFADLLIVSPETSFETTPEGIPTRFVKDVLANAECPVIIAPLSFHKIEEILFAYNESPSSVFALKQFTYLFPELTNKKLTIVHISEGNAMEKSGKKNFKEFIKTHFPNQEFKSLHGKSEEELFRYLLGKENIFVILGAYGRGIISTLFKPNPAELLVKNINLPFFIAHR